MNPDSIPQIFTAIERFDARLANCPLTRTQHGLLMEAVQVLKREMHKILVEGHPEIDPDDGRMTYDPLKDPANQP